MAASKYQTKPVKLSRIKSGTLLLLLMTREAPRPIHAVHSRCFWSRQHATLVSQQPGGRVPYRTSGERKGEGSLLSIGEMVDASASNQRRRKGEIRSRAMTVAIKTSSPLEDMLLCARFGIAIFLCELVTTNACHWTWRMVSYRAGISNVRLLLCSQQSEAEHAPLICGASGSPMHTCGGRLQRGVLFPTSAENDSLYSHMASTK